jgi:tetratricopeptide (TPR) repeat protein
MRADSRPRLLYLTAVLGVALLALSGSPAAAEPNMRQALARPIGKDFKDLPCAPRDPEQVGPWDYHPRNALEKENVRKVESFHFTADVANLRRGSTSAYVPHDLEYTLNKIPNHYRALNAAIDYALGGPNGESRKPPLQMPPECYLERSLVFRPNDPNLRVIYGNLLFRVKKLDEAAARYEEALKLAPQSAEAHYNLALTLLELKQPEKAREHAQAAYKLGHPAPGLRKKLEDAGMPL